jgi:formylglycine-generating enzyme required for sulfatase activity
MDGDVVGTPSYMSPEQALGRLDEVGAQSDVYSTGAMLYHLLTGHAPYAEPGVRVSNHGIWYQVQVGPPTPLHERAPHTPAELVAICDKAMARDWSARYGDTSELAEDLSAFLEHRVVHAYQTGAVAELRKWIVRNRGLAGALAAGMLVLVIGLATSLVLKALAENRLDKLVQLSQLQDREDLLARADLLWPPHPESIAKYQGWIREAQALVADLPQHRARREELRRHALPLTEDERTAQRESLPDHAEVVRLEGEITCRRRALLQRRDGVRAELPGIDESKFPDDVARLRALAWERVAPNRELHGEEPLGLALALRARAIAPGDLEVVRAVAWGCFALGRDDDALDAGFAALGAAPEQQRQAFEDLYAELEGAVAASPSEDRIQRAGDELDGLEQRRALLSARVDERRDWRFPEREPEARWWNNQLTKLIEGLESLQRELLSEDGISPAHGWSVPKRLAFAGQLERGHARGGEYRLAWERALPAILETYPGLALTPQVGLVPIGPDPRSGLWEFAHLQTGDVPERDAQGQLVLTEQSGLVFVLLPGGKFRMGAQARDPAGPNYDPQAEAGEAPVQEVSLAAFFLSKHEMTQGQWLRSTGENPSFHYPGQLPGVTLLNPVEMVSWNDCARALSWAGLVLPTEAQWEYAARAGSSTPWWTGELRESLRGNVNLADRALRRAGATLFTPDDWPDLDDGFGGHAPVNALGPNPFGLCNVLGNVFEWCRDGSGSYENLGRGDDGERTGLPSHKIYRGGGFIDIAAHARSSCRSSDVTDYRSEALGVRPARVVER